MFDSFRRTFSKACGPKKSAQDPEKCVELTYRTVRHTKIFVWGAQVTEATCDVKSFSKHWCTSSWYHHCVGTVHHAIISLCGWRLTHHSCHHHLVMIHWWRLTHHSDRGLLPCHSFNTTGTHALLTRLVHNRHAITILWVGQTHRHAIIILWLCWVGDETMLAWCVCQNTRWWIARWCVVRAHKMMIAWWWIIDDVARRCAFRAQKRRMIAPY